MLAIFHAAQEVIQPIMLRSQVYSLVEDRTMVDRELDELRYAWTSPEFLLLICMSPKDCACFVDLTDDVSC